MGANQSTNHLDERGVNGGLAGVDMRVLRKPDRKINIVGLDDHDLTGLDVMTNSKICPKRRGEHFKAPC